eukprot:NODE_3044_length_1061_cov_32.608696_g2795_i0.p1 GENE.NODE_3044_length_1061_cov_32.608696_g2795_i0~~NODE_3044_length_1061_cov_32.608696_g2795_i0.p1  ORF type:complete len:314 (+),score=74.99 NODE_3044_length_1061_cov_32.608696_g2795_i0:64-942(+)
MTVLQYFRDTYLFQDRAIVVAIRPHDDVEAAGKWAVVLDRTIFHPQGGGQPADRGQLRSCSSTVGDDGGAAADDAPSTSSSASASASASATIFDVVDVRKVDGAVLHIGTFRKGTEFKVQDEVCLDIDAEWRLNNARIHSAGHLLDTAMAKVGASLREQLVPGKGYHFPDSPYVEYQGKVDAAFRETLAAQLNEELRELISAATPVQTFNDLTLRAAQTLCGASEEPASVANEGGDGPADFRVVEISGTACMCGGTHVRNVSELVAVTVTKVQGKGKNTRVYYTVTAPVRGN